MINLATWNMQGSSHSTENKWNAGVLNLFSMGLDVCCLQECGGVPASARRHIDPSANVGFYSWGGTTSRPGLYILFYPWDSKGNRCNLAVVSRVHPKARHHALPGQGPQHRPAIGMELDQVMIFTIHAISPSGVDAPGLMAQIATTANGKPWIAAGDFNRDPETMRRSGLVVCPPEKPTHPSHQPSSRLDYAVKSWGHAAKGSVLQLFLSDHLPVVFQL